MTRRTLTVVVVGPLVAGAAAISIRSASAQGAITADLVLSNGKSVTDTSSTRRRIRATSEI